MKKTKEKNLAAIIAVVVAVIAVAVLIVFLITRKPAEGNGGQDESWTNEEIDKRLQGDEWIDCMPPLSGYEARLCERAEEIGYPRIAY